MARFDGVPCGPKQMASGFRFGGTTFIDSEQLLRSSPNGWLVHQLIKQQSLVVLAGTDPGETTRGAIDISLSLVHGTPFAGMRVRPDSVLYLAGEGQHSVAPAIRTWPHAPRHRVDDRYCVIGSEVPVLDDGQALPRLAELVDRVDRTRGHPPSLVVIDTLAHGLMGDVDDPTVIKRVLRALLALRNRCRCTILVTGELVALPESDVLPVALANEEWGMTALDLAHSADTVLALIPARRGSNLEVWKQRDAARLVAPLHLPSPRDEHRRGL